MAILERIHSAHLNERKFDLRIPILSKLHELYLNEIASSLKEQLKYIQFLVDSHYLFMDESQKESDAPIVRYIVAESSVIRKLKDWASQELEEKFEQRFYRRYHINRVINEILASPDKYSRSEMGILLDLVLLLGRYEQWIIVNSREYSLLWKQEKLRELLKKNNKVESREIVEKEVAIEVDPKEVRKTQISMIEKKLEEIQQEDNSEPWGSLKKHYGLENLVNIHLRKREFSTILSLLEKRRIAQEKHLRYLKTALQKLMENTLFNIDLQRYENSMLQVKRLAQMRLNDIQALRKELQKLQRTEQSSELQQSEIQPSEIQSSKLQSSEQIKDERSFEAAQVS